MSRKKLKKIREVYTLPNVFSREQVGVEKLLKEYFSNNNSFTLEIGCGHGDYTDELASIYPDRNFIGIDVKGARVYTGAKKALDLNLKNVAFLLTGAEHLDKIFINERIEEIYIPFPDPHYKRKSIRRRLIAPDFLEIYQSILQYNGKVHLKTDNDEFYNYALKILRENKWNILYSTPDLYSIETPGFLHNIQTKYEKHYIRKGRIIKYLCFKK